MQALPWIVALVALLLLAASLAGWPARWSQRRQRPAGLPSEWDLVSRPVFSADERQLYRLLREALPHHVLLPKLPLVRFCLPTDPGDAPHWHQLLGTIQVGFAICSENGRVLTAIDLDVERRPSRREAQIKREVLSACRVRYLRCAVDQLPTVAELQMLVPRSGSQASISQPPDRRRSRADARDDAGPSAGARRPARPGLWQEPPLFHDSFFNPAGRSAAAPPTHHAPSRADDRVDDDDEVDDRTDRGGARGPVFSSFGRR